MTATHRMTIEDFNALPEGPPYYELTLRRQAIGYGVRTRYGRRAAPRRYHACGQSRASVRESEPICSSCARRCGVGA